jgi:cysteine sulfinate desulfinase/cysteine desulfurase-like protein
MKLAGLAFSGGGVRSATFNLGTIQALAQAGRLHQFHYRARAVKRREMEAALFEEGLAVWQPAKGAEPGRPATRRR